MNTGKNESAKATNAEMPDNSLEYSHTECRHKSDLPAFIQDLSGLLNSDSCFQSFNF